MLGTLEDKALFFHDLSDSGFARSIAISLAMCARIRVMVQTLKG